MVNEKKIQLVLETIELIKKYPIVGIVNMENLPAQQLQDMRAMLRGRGVKIKMLRKKLIKRALTESGKKNIEELSEKIKGLPALILTEDNPFILNSTIQKNKSEAPAKAGQTLSKDVEVKSGPTNFAPGPIISELASVGIKTKVENGKLTIVADAIVAKEGDIVSAKLAETLKRLDVKPMEVGLDLVAVWEDGLVFDAKQLYIDEQEYTDNITQAASWAMNLAMEAGIFTSETSELLIQKAFREAKAVAIEAAYLTEETRDEILARAESEANLVRETAGVDVSQAARAESVSSEDTESKK